MDRFYGGDMVFLHGRRRSRLLVALAAAATLTLSSPGVPASAHMSSVAAVGDVELIGYSEQLLLDGVPHVVEDGQVVPAEDAVTTMDFPPTGVHTFTRSAPAWSFGDRYVTGNEQMRYSTNYEQWSCVLTPAVRNIVVGNVTQIADLYHYSTRRHYGRHIVGAGYLFHGSMGNIESRGTYSTTFRATFRHNVAGGGNGVISAQWNWQRR